MSLFFFFLDSSFLTLKSFHLAQQRIHYHEQKTRRFAFLPPRKTRFTYYSTHVAFDVNSNYFSPRKRFVVDVSRELSALIFLLSWTRCGLNFSWKLHQMTTRRVYSSKRFTWSAPSHFTRVCLQISASRRRVWESRYPMSHSTSPDEKQHMWGKPKIKRRKKSAHIW